MFNSYNATRCLRTYSHALLPRLPHLLLPRLLLPHALLPHMLLPYAFLPRTLLPNALLTHVLLPQALLPQALLFRVLSLITPPPIPPLVPPARLLLPPAGPPPVLSSLPPTRSSQAPSQPRPAPASRLRFGKIRLNLALKLGPPQLLSSKLIRRVGAKKRLRPRLILQLGLSHVKSMRRTLILKRSFFI